MGINLVTGHAGRPHVTSSDQGLLYASVYGSGVYIINGCEAAKVDNNTVHINKGALLVQGRHITFDELGVDVAIENGTVGAARTDCICISYSMDEITGVETVETVVVKGKRASAAASGNILDGDKEVVIPIYEATVSSSLVLGEPVKIAQGFITYREAIDVFDADAQDKIDQFSALYADVQRDLGNMTDTVTQLAYDRIDTRLGRIEDGAY